MNLHPLPLQPQTVTDHTHTTQCHSCTGDHRIEQEAVYRIENTCCNRNTDEVIDKCPKQVLLNCRNGLFGQTYSLRYFGQIGGYDGHFGNIHRNVTSPAQSDTHICCRECRTVNDTVPDHSHYPTLLL